MASSTNHAAHAGRSPFRSSRGRWRSYRPQRWLCVFIASVLLTAGRFRVIVERVRPRLLSRQSGPGTPPMSVRLRLEGLALDEQSQRAAMRLCARPARCSGEGVFGRSARCSGHALRSRRRSGRPLRWHMRRTRRGGGARGGSGRRRFRRGLSATVSTAGHMRRSAVPSGMRMMPRLGVGRQSHDPRRRDRGPPATWMRRP